MFQIDIKPIHPQTKFSRMVCNLYIDGMLYTTSISSDDVDRMVKEGVVAKTKGHRHNDKGELEEFDYPNGLDGAGVMYTSKMFNLTEYVAT